MPQNSHNILLMVVQTWFLLTYHQQRKLTNVLIRNCCENTLQTLKVGQKLLLELDCYLNIIFRFPFAEEISKFRVWFIKLHLFFEAKVYFLLLI
jgi:hypothetical protein